MNPNARKFAQKYGQVALQAGVEFSDPHRLIQMLFQGALDKISVARGHLERREIAKKGQHISWAISIIEGLRTSLDHERGGEIARNLEDLYEYMKRRLVEANLSNDAEILNEVASLLGEIKGAWDAIAPGQQPAP